MTALLLLHAIVGLAICAAAARVAVRTALLAAAAPMLATLVWLAAVADGVLDGSTVDERTEWVGALGLGFDLRLDGFSAVIVLLVAGIGLAVVAYSVSYFAHAEEGTVRLVGLLVLFAGSMLGIVLANDLLVLFGFWELTSITSFLLIGNAFGDASARAAALQALLVTSAGSLAMLGGFVVLGQAAGTYRLSELLADPPSGTAVEVALGLILLGAFTKSAQYPFHAWLPGAMIAPTPVSAYLHSATMVKAGVYLVARLSPAFAADVSWWRPVVIGVGLVTMIAGGLRALRQYDLKLLLAYGTISQLGLMMTVFAIGTPEAAVAGTVLLLAHGLFKAAAFMNVGIVDHEVGSRDVRLVPPLRGHGWTPSVVVAAIGAASMAGVPLTFGFIAKESVFAAVDDAGSRWWSATLWGLVAGSAVTVAYSARFAVGAAGGLHRPDAGPTGAAMPRQASTTAQPLHGGCAPEPHRRAAPWRSHARPAPPAPPAFAYLAPAALLVALTVALGLAPATLDRVATSAGGALAGLAEPAHLSIWHGVNAALVGSLVALAGGAVLYRLRRSVGRALATGTAIPSSLHAYRQTLRGLNIAADRVTSVVQSGSLPVYTGVILATSAVVPAIALAGAEWPGWPDLVDTPVHIPIVAVIITAAVAAAAVRRRFSAALFLGVVGYAMAALFIAQGAPDLALTQAAIETLSTVLFVLVLRRLPDGFMREVARARRALRLAVAALVGVTVFALAIMFAAPEPDTPTSDQMVAQALPEGDGRNVVNVILVDFRGFDTMGELMVLGSAAIGAVALARAGRRPRDAGSPRDPQREAPAPPRVAVARLATLDTSVRLVFAAVLTGSVYLLFAGHNQPGGGFVGGIIAGAAVSLRYVAGGIDEVRRLSRARPWTVLGAGLLIAVVTALVPVLAGGSVLESGAVTFSPPLLGEIKLTSALVFDIGVYLAVIGLVLMVFESFGDDPSERAADDTTARLESAT